MFADCHLHSSFSNDSQTPMEDMIRKAVSLGMDEICFTEHVDYGIEGLQNCDYPSYLETLYAMREKYSRKIKIRAGIEFGVQLETIEEYKKVSESFDFDLIIFSCHQINNQEFWNNQFQAGKTQDEFHSAYYNAIFDVMKVYKDYSVLGHLDVIKRYDTNELYPDEKILPLAENIMKLAVRDGKGIEVNTSALRYGLPGSSPSKRLLELYYELGGKIITIGSDAHHTDFIGDHIPETQKMLRSIGFKEICTFEHRKPVFHKL